MRLHSRARTCPASRALLVDRITRQEWGVDEAAEAAGISRRTAYKWLKRHRLQGLVGLRDRSSSPRTSSRRTSVARRELIVKLRQSRLTATQIAHRLRMPRSTIARLLKQAGLERLRYLKPPEPVVRYEREHPGDLLHLDIKRLGKIGRVGHRIHGDRRTRVHGIGWEFAHVAIDDYSRVAYVEVLPREDGVTTAAFLRRALIWFKRQGVRVRRILTDNGSGYRSHQVGSVCQDLDIKHRWTRPYRPQTNGKAERFIQTLLREWAYVRPYQNSGRRRAALGYFLVRYNLHRPHGGIMGKAPISRLRSRGEQRA